MGVRVKGRMALAGFVVGFILLSSDLRFTMVLSL